MILGFLALGRSSRVVRMCVKEEMQLQHRRGDQRGLDQVCRRVSGNPRTMIRGWRTRAAAPRKPG
jgi:hypothetical protein